MIDGIVYYSLYFSRILSVVSRNSILHRGLDPRKYFFVPNYVHHGVCIQLYLVEGKYSNELDEGLLPRYYRYKITCLLKATYIVMPIV